MAGPIEGGRLVHDTRARDAATSPPKLFFTPTLDQFKAVFDQGIGPAMLNSVFATGISTILVLALGTPAAFALSLRPVRKTQDALFFFMSTKMLPIVAAILPLYVIVSNIGLLDNIWALVILYTSMNLPIAVWMMRSFFLEVPHELLEAAEMDGAPLRRTMREVILPVVLEDAAIREEVLTERKGKKVILLCPQRGDKVRLVEMAQIQSTDMAELGVMAHDLPGSSLPLLTDRARSLR